jgi:hypothetical protein
MPPSVQGGCDETYESGPSNLGWSARGCVVINVVEYVTNGVVLRDWWAQAMQAMGKPAEISAGAIVTFNAWGFLLGIAAVWIYAAIRPRYGAGPSTAARAGIAASALAVFLANLSTSALGYFPHACS